MKRVYLAVVHGVPKAQRGRIESRLIELADGRMVSTRRHAAGERAITDYEVIGVAGENALLRVTLLTGRKHQIRTHLAERGHPVLGDRMYGPVTPNQQGGRQAILHLCAVELAFADPLTEKLRTFAIEPAWLLPKHLKPPHHPL